MSDETVSATKRAAGRQAQVTGRRPFLDGYYPLGYLAVLVLLCGALLAAYAQYRVIGYKEVQRNAAERAAVGVAHETALYLDELRRRLRIFTLDNAVLIERLAARPEDAEAFRALDERLSLAFPLQLAFAVAGPDGRVLMEDPDGGIDESCRSELQAAAGAAGPPDIHIHPMPGAYHFDIIVPRYDRDGQMAGMFLVSFRPDVLARLLGNAAFPGIELVLVRGEIPLLVEITAQGRPEQAPGGAGRSLDLDPGAMLARSDIATTRWSVLAKAVPGFIDAEIRHLWGQVAVTYLLAVALMGVLGGLWVRRLRRRRAAGDALRGIAEAIGRSTGEAFFHALTRSLAETLGVRCALVGELPAPDASTAKIRSLWDARAKLELHEYELEGTPCGKALEAGVCVVPKGLAAAYPKASALQGPGLEAFIGVPLLDSGGGALGLLAVMHDRPIADVEGKRSLVQLLATRASAELERLRIARALERSEAQYRYLVESSRELIWSMGPDGRFTYVNEAARAILGYAPQELIGTRLEALAPADHQEAHVDLVRRVLAGASAEDYELDCLHRNGQRRRLLVNARPRCDESGAVVGLSGTGSDVTDVFRAQRDTKNNSEIFSAILSKLPVFFFRLDAQGRVTDIRGHGLVRVGVEPEQLIGRPILELFAGKSRRVSAALGGKTVLFEVRGGSSDRPWWYTVSLFFDHWRGGGALGFAIDATERKLAEEKLVRLVRENRSLARRLVEVQEDERNRLSRELHDELGQSITAVKSLAIAISRLDEQKIGEVRRLGATIVDLSSHLYEVVKNIMHRLRPDVIDSLGIEDALKDCVDKSQLETMGVGVRLETKGDLEGLNEVVKVTIYRIVQECLTNVAKYAMASNVHIKIFRQYLPAAERRHLPRFIPGGGSESSQSLPANLFRDTLTIVVSDDGVGMDIRQAMDRENKISQGLGLQGIRERVTALGGRFEVYSETGRGVQLTIVIDLEAHRERGGDSRGPADGKDIHEEVRKA